METKLIKISEDNFSATIKQAGRILKNGGLVAFPTETVYGLGGDALDKEASKKIYAAKGRPSDNPLIVHIADFSDIYAITKDMDERAKKLSDAFWPGPLTMILNKSERVPYETTGGLDTVAVRMPDNGTALALIKAAGGYIAAPSANTSGRPSPTRAERVYEDLNGKIPMILDGGAVGIGIESTIIDLSGDEPLILRPGYITPEMLKEVIGDVKFDPALTEAKGDAAPKAPGMKYRHYAPKAQLILVRGDQKKVTEKIVSLIDEAHADGKKVGILCATESQSDYKAEIVESLGKRGDEEEIARNLFEKLREFDEKEVDIIYSECFEETGLGVAVMNRMIKAAGHQILDI